MKKLIAIIDCGIKRNSLFIFNQLVRNFPQSFTYHIPSTQGMESLYEAQEQNLAYIILGSFSNVEDRLPWQKELARHMLQELEKGKPVLALCFGHQLLADAFGLTIIQNPNHGTLQGMRQVTILNDHPLVKAGETFTLIKAHSYQVANIAPPFIHIGHSPECPHDIIAHERLPLFSLQTHPEASDYFIENDVKAELSPADKKLTRRDGLEIISRFLKWADSFPNSK